MNKYVIQLRNGSTVNAKGATAEEVTIGNIIWLEIRKESGQLCGKFAMDSVINWREE